MSLFRTLQNAPSTITLFHNSKLPLLNKLYGILSKANYKLNEDTLKIVLDLMENTLPTYDQYSLIFHSCLKDTYSKNALQKCFPFVNGKSEDKIGQDRTTVKSPVEIGRLLQNGLKMFNEGEYAMIVEAFNGLQLASLADASASEVFKAPLVVDWDQNLIANDEHGVNVILSKYKQSARAEALA